MSYTTEIMLNKKAKIIGLIVISIVALLSYILLLGIVFPLLQSVFTFKLVILIILTSLYWWIIPMIGKPLFSKNPALLITELGIEDNSSPASVGFIPWDDITEIQETTNELKKKLILIMVKNSEKYTHMNGVKYSNLRSSYVKQFHTPIVLISSNFLMDHDEVLGLLRSKGN